MRLEKKENLKMEEKSEIWIEMLPASQGDCILVTMPDADIRILIDGGIGDTYKDSLKERLLQLNSENKAIDLLVVTHIDNDHIGGIVELLKENGSDSESKIIKIENIWHNSYRHLQFDRALQTGKAEEQILKKVIAKGAVREKQEKKSGRQEISALQGTTLAAMILQGGYCWNSQFGGMAVSSQTGKIYLGQCCTIRVLLHGRKELADHVKRQLQFKAAGRESVYPGIPGGNRAGVRGYDRRISSHCKGRHRFKQPENHKLRPSSAELSGMQRTDQTAL